MSKHEMDKFEEEEEFLKKRVKLQKSWFDWSINSILKSIKKWQEILKTKF